MKRLVILVTLAVVVLIALSVSACGAALHSTEETRTLTVQEKAPSTDQKPYRVFTTSGTTYAVEDSVFYWNFRSSDRWGSLKVGHTYSCKTAGWRLGFLSSYRNLIDCHEVTR